MAACVKAYPLRQVDKAFALTRSEAEYYFM